MGIEEVKSRKELVQQLKQQLKQAEKDKDEEKIRSLNIQIEENTPNEGLISAVCTDMEYQLKPKFKDDISLSELIAGFFTKDLLGIGISKSEVEKACQKDIDIFKKIREYDDAFKMDQTLRYQLKQINGVEPTNEDFSNMTQYTLKCIQHRLSNGSAKKLDSQQAKNKYEQEQENMGEGLTDLIAGIASYMCYASCVGGGGKLGKTSLAISFGLTALMGGLSKVLLKFMDPGVCNLIGNISSDSKFNIETDISINDFWKGAFAGVLAPLSGGIGGSIGRSLAKRAGLTISEHMTGTVINTSVKRTFGKTVKDVLTNYGGYNYTKGSKAMIAGVVGTEMAVDGALGGALDCGFRTAIDGGNSEEVQSSMIQGGLVGLVFAPAIGGMFRKIASYAEQDWSEIADCLAKFKSRFNILFFGKTHEERKLLLNYLDRIDYDNYKIVTKCIKNKKIKIDKGLIDLLCEIDNVYCNYPKTEFVTKFHEKLLFDKKFSDISNKTKAKLVDRMRKGKDKDYQKAIYRLDNHEKLEINPNHIPALIGTNITKKQVKNLYRTIGKEKIKSLTSEDVEILAPFAKLHGIKNINEIPMQEKKAFLRSLVNSNTGMFELSDAIRMEFPILPKNQQEYCSLLPSLVRSMGIETKKLTPKERIIYFHNSTGSLSKKLKELSDEDFAKLTIRQEYSKEEFIRKVLEKVQHLSRKECQKVYDYFGFEIHHNKNTKLGYTISGYPANLNNGHKLTQIDDEGTREVIESLREDVIRFSEKNRIICDNKEVEELLNSLTESLPEMRTMIGRAQHGSHDFDVMKHSLKVFQKVSQNPAFDKLSESDKKVMTLASLLHDITKAEGLSDKLHAKESSFDAFYIAKKFDLTREEEIKLYKLIKHHEWLAYVNSAKNEHELTKRLQSVAYDLQQDNLFDLSLMFTHADLKAVKKDNLFHDKASGRGRVAFKGSKRVFGVDENSEVKSFGESADLYAERIRGYAKELQKSQPLLPVTKMPKASTVRKAITIINPDGSTNIKGVYINKEADGKELVVIKFNEVENWEAIGLPKGSSNKGYKIKEYKKGKDDLFVSDSEVETGNIKFFVHGLDYENQLAKFDAFSLVDSEVLLSVSYAERPETKFRFFRPQGVMLNAQTKYVHGGGKTDSGSGCGKFIKEFKDRYIFGGDRESDRLYISKLIKKATGMNDEEYIRFVKANENKSMMEIEPKDARDKILKALATINSNKRHGNREYNEMYISNPDEVMGTFAYAENYDKKIGNPIKWLKRKELEKHESKIPQERTSFLRKYSVEHDIPMYIFGN